MPSVEDDHGHFPSGKKSFNTAVTAMHSPFEINKKLCCSGSNAFSLSEFLGRRLAHQQIREALLRPVGGGALQQVRGPSHGSMRFNDISFHCDGCH